MCANVYDCAGQDPACKPELLVTLLGLHLIPLYFFTFSIFFVCLHHPILCFDSSFFPSSSVKENTSACGFWNISAQRIGPRLSRISKLALTEIVVDRFGA